jgi:hypothetical protein
VTAEAQAKVLEVAGRLAEFATETCLSEGDLLRLTDEMIDWRFRVVVPEGGMMKTGSEAVRDALRSRNTAFTIRGTLCLERLGAPRRQYRYSHEGFGHTSVQMHKST